MSLKEYLLEQQQLEEDAGRLFSGRIDQCTSSMGFLCQRIFSCRSCATSTSPLGVCYACSVSCHSNCDLVELDVRSSFRCDCGILGLSCSLEPSKETVVNWYQGPSAKCFRGEFCVDNCQLDPTNTDEVMIQCQSCENWIHQTCAMSLDVQVDSRSCDASIPNGNSIDRLTEHHHDGVLVEREEDWVCCDCLEVYPFLKRLLSVELDIESEDRVCLSSSQQEIQNKLVETSKQGLFCFAENWREVICNCENCVQLLKQHHLMHLITKPSIYEPETDADAGSSLYDLGNRSLMNNSDLLILRQGITAVDNLKRKLTIYLDTFVQENRIVTKDDIDSFFRQIKKSR